jgi:hypothetical protein
MPRVGKSIGNHSLLVAALEGLQLQKQRIEDQIRQVRLLLGKSANKGGPPGSANKKTGPGRLSPAARKRIAAAQKRRWAEYRKSSAGKGA